MSVNSYKILREKSEKKFMIFAHPLENIFQIATTNSFTIELDRFLETNFTRDTSNCPVELSKISREGDKCL